MNTIDSPINYHCPECWAVPGQHCVNLSSSPAMGLFHNSRRAARMAALARASVQQSDTLADRYVRAASDRTESRQTTFKRPQPTLFDGTQPDDGTVGAYTQFRETVTRLADEMWGDYEGRWDS